MAQNTDTTQAADPSEAPPPMASKPGRRFWLRVPFTLLLQAVLLLLLVVFWVLGTQSGLRFALSLGEELAPGLLQVERADGRILGDLHLEGLSVRPPGVELRFSNLDLRWSPLAALTGTLRISELSARELDIAIAPSEDEEAASGPVELPELLLPQGLELALEQALVGRLSISTLHGDTLHEDSRFRIDRIGLAAHWSGTQVALKGLTLTLPEPQLQADAQGEVDLTGDYPLALGLTWKLAREPALELAGQATIGGDLDTLYVENNLTGSVQAEVRALVRGVLDRLRWAGEVRILGVDLPALQADLPVLDLSGTLTTGGDLDNARVQGNLTGVVPDLPDVGRPQAKLDVRWRDGALDIADLKLTENKSGARLTAGGELDLWDPAGKVDLQVTWEGLRWPLVGEPVTVVEQGDLRVQGALDKFSYRISSEVSGRDFPAAQLRLTGKGNRQAARIDNLRIDTLDGKIEAKGRVAWSPEPSWAFTLVADGLDPGRQWPEWGGVLDGRILSKGELKDGGPEFSAQIASLTGKLRGYPVDAVAGIRMQGSELRVDELRVASGPNSLKAVGSVGERLDLALNIDAPDLKSLLPDAQGSIQADGAVTGTLATPAVSLDLIADGVAVAGQSIRGLKGTAQVDLAPGGPVKIDLTGQDLVAGGMVFGSLSIQGKGDMGAHRLSAQVTGAPLALDFEASGSLKGDNAYVGRLEGLALRTQKFGNWRLQQTVPIDLAGARISAGPLCIREEAGSGGCARFTQQEAGRWNAALDLDRLAFDLFKGFIPEDLVLAGAARAEADFQAAGGILTGTAGVRVVEGKLTTLHGGHPEQLDFTSAQLAVDAGKKGLRAKLAVPLTGLGKLSADASLPGWSLNQPARPQQPLRGGVQARIKDLGIVSRLVPDITHVTGNLKADFKLGGTFAKPGLRGAARLAGGGLQVPFIGLKVADLTFDAQAKGLDRIEYRGGLKAGQGRLEIKGSTLLGAEGPITRIGAQGKRLMVANSKEYFVLASPDLQAEIGPTGAKLTGTVTVPEARIRPRNLPAGIASPSSNVVILSEMQGRQSRYATNIDLRLVLGEQVTVDAFGLKGAIQGELAVLQTPGKELLGDGKLEIVEGTYRISVVGPLSADVGTPLTIEQGFLSYAKSPIDNPHLILTAQREGGDITAGLRVFGTIKNPKLTFFSATDPGMSQSEVTKYLVTGIPPKRSGEGQPDQAISLGTYIAPKVFAEYDYSLGNESDKIKLRYDLNDWIELQAETGDAQGGDIFFTLEH
ncbi:translocation/assembly module TamB domain-containing protein [Candidatus Thiosymbion oneisti]|uniref:translocation/assembly module TamB domain-containing protein n=1 Tax=Candidatus Thiosymbion oneisti TaxID=589554 RepID=UPI00105ED69E|nr:translocation/assembly module TamB domain-containing protein [Candidatus Thiosymbion oneisti]